MCGVFFGDGSTRGEAKPVESEASEVLTNTNPIAPSAAEPHTNTSSVLAGSSGNTPVSLRPFQLALPRDHLFRDWFGVRSKAEDLGISPTLTFVSDVAGNVTGGKSQGVTHADNLGLDLLFDLDKLSGLKGGSFLVSMSQRSGSSLSKEHVGNVFSIQQVYGGQTFHLIDLAYQQRLFNDRLELRLGRIAAGDDFLVSIYNYLFMQNGFCGNPVGIFFNAPGMTAYPNATWGILLKVRPTERTYIMGAVYNGDSSIRDNEHNGADMSMNGPVFAIGEVGYQANGLPGDSRWLGNYKAGFWYDDASFTDFTTAGYEAPAAEKRGSWGCYGLFDQILVPFSEPTSNRGFGVFGSFTLAPDQSISQMPYFFTAGVACRGIFTSRPRDVAGLGVVCGHFSNDLRHAQEREQQLDTTVGIQDYETVLEWTYRLYFGNGAVFFQPDIQYVINPGGTGKLENALVLGCQIGINL